jgi:hypothetical protein
VKAEVGGWRWSRVVLWLSALLMASYMINDTYIMQNVIRSTDPFSCVMAYLTLGSVVGLTINFFLCHTLVGKWVDPSFERINWISGKAQWSAIITGVIGSITTLFLLWGSQIFDPSIVLPLSNLYILYVVIYDVLAGKVAFRNIWLPALLVVGGAMLFTFDFQAGVFVSITGLLVLLVCRNGLNALAKILEQKGAIASDAISFSFWRFFWLTVSGLVIVVVMTTVRGMWPEYLRALLTGLVGWKWVVLTMVLVFFATGFENFAKRYELVSVVVMVLTMPVVLGVPFTALINWFWPGTFVGVPTDYLGWLVRLVGAGLVFWGLYRLPRS